MIAFVLIFLRKFDDLSTVPAAYTSMIIVIVAGGPGKTVGACVQGVCLALLGVGVGAGFFAILAKLAHFPIAQAVVFAAIVYSEFSLRFSTLLSENLPRAPIPGGPYPYKALPLRLSQHTLDKIFRLRNANDVIYLI